MPNSPEVVAERLIASMEELKGEFAAVRQHGVDTRNIAKRTRLMVRALAVGAALIGIILMLLVVIFVRADESFDKAREAFSATEQINLSRVASCEATNDQRQDSKALWESIIALEVETATAQGQELTEADRKEIEQFQVLINKAYALRDCEALAVGGDGTSPG